MTFLVCVQRDDPVGHKNSNGRPQCLRRLCEEWGSRLERDRDLGSGSIVWLKSKVQLGVTASKQSSERLTVRGPGMRATVRFVTCISG